MRDNFGVILSTAHAHGNMSRNSAPHSYYQDSGRARSMRSRTAIVPRPPAGAPTSTSRYVTPQRPYTVVPHSGHISTSIRDLQSVNGSGSGGYTGIIASLTYNVKKQTAQRTERGSLPAAHQQRTLVGNGRYTLYKTASGGKLTASGAGPDTLQYRSLPGSRTQHVVDDHARIINSAPNHQKEVASFRSPQPSLPRINNLVNGKYSNEQAPSDRARNTQKYTHGRKRQKHVKELTEEGHAGVSTRDHDAQTLASSKFASSWANARVDHVARDSSRDRTEAAVSPRAEQEEEKPPGTKGTKDYPKPWLMKPTPARTTSVSTQQNKDSTAVNAKGTLQSPAETVDSENKTVSENQDNKDSKKPPTRRIGVTVPPRRERTRMRIQRAKSEAILDGKLLAELNQQQAGNDKGPARRYSNVDAANVYYVNAAAAIPPLPTRRNSRNTLKHDDSATNQTLADGVIPEEEEGEDAEADESNRKPKEYILNRRESQMYVNIRSVYDKGTEKYRETRERRFYRAVEDLQKEKWRQENAEYQQRKVREKETKRRQSKQLKRVRERFDEEQVRRFRNQYVTSKVLEHEYQTRHIYGLPDRVGGEPEYEAKLRPRAKRPERVFDPAEKKEKNKRRWKKLFKMNRGPRWDPRAKTPKMEGIDTIVIGGSDTEGEAPGRKLGVKDIVGDAQQLLDDDNESSTGSPRKTEGSKTTTKARPTESNKENNKTNLRTNKTNLKTNQTNDFLTLKPDEDDLSDLDLSEDEDPDEDIFEKARRKYNIVLDSDDEDL